MSAHLAGAYTATLLVRVNVVKGGGRAPPPLPARANFTLMMECTPEIGRYHSVYSVVSRTTILICTFTILLFNLHYSMKVLYLQYRHEL